MLDAVSTPDDKQNNLLDFPFHQLVRHVTFQPPPNQSPTPLLNRLGAVIPSAILCHQSIYFTTRPPSSSYTSINTSLATNFKATRRPTEHTITIFWLKILVDYCNLKRGWDQKQYSKGALVGGLGYLIGRPLDQLDRARNQIWANQSKVISRLQAVRVVLRHDGPRGFYKHENILGLACPSIYYSVLFGLWAKFVGNRPQKNAIFDCCLLPLPAAFCASLSTAIPDKMRSFCWHTNQARSRSLDKRYGKKGPSPAVTLQLLMEFMTSKEFMFKKSDLVVMGYSVIKNWLALGLFAYGQLQVDIQN